MQYRYLLRAQRNLTRVMQKVLIAAGADLVTANATGKRPIDLVREDRVGNTLHEAMALAAADGLPSFAPVLLFLQ